jgi:hypothetical protein
VSKLADDEANLVCCDLPGNQRRARGGCSGTFNDLFKNSIFRHIVISLSATIGLYVFASHPCASLFFGTMDGH